MHCIDWLGKIGKLLKKVGEIPEFLDRIVTDGRIALLEKWLNGYADLLNSVN